MAKQDEIYIPEIFSDRTDLALHAHQAGIDLEMLAENLSLTPEERLVQHQDLLNTIEELRKLRKSE